MEKIIKTTIENELLKASKEKREAVLSVPWFEIIEKIGEKYLLTKEETEDIQRETGVTILGLRNREDFLFGIEKIVIQEDLSKKIFDEITEKILSVIALKIKPDLKTTNQQTNKQTGERKVSTINTEEAIKRSGWQEKLLEISQKNNLNIEQSGILEDVVVKTMKNEISSEKFFSEVSSLVTKDSEKAINITKEVNEQIFQEIRTLMMEGEGREEEVKETIEEKIPLPPYANNEKPKEEEKKTTEVKSNEVKRLQEILDSENKNASFGGIKNVDYNVPKTFSNTKPSGVEQPQIVTTKPHDPYREII